MAGDIHGCTLVHTFWNNPSIVHKRAVIFISKYLLSTSTYMDLQDSNKQLYIYGVV